MTQLQIQASRPYTVYIEPDAVKRLVEVPEAQQADQFWIITDQTVAALHLATVCAQLDHCFNKKQLISRVEPGEASKSLAVYQRVLEDGIEKGATRKTVVLAVGGGMIGDLAGFVAATFLRGVPFIQIPTTLLAHDSSVGGKVGLNLRWGKNLVGAFYQPSAVLYDITFLRTLSDREWRSGFFELLKHGLLARPTFAHDLLELDLAGVKQLPLADSIAAGIAVKQRIVEQDEWESGVRAFLNYGHTFGHAVEYVSPGLSHGEAVGIGLVFVSFVEGNLDQAKRVVSLIKRLGVTLPERQAFQVYLDLMRRDKKNNASIRFVVQRQGEFKLEEVDEDRLRKAYDQTVRCLQWD
ncbi:MULTISPECIES: 3-dehydroquinate synthase family protein [Exiguobacterium]|uniref:3-dehydroquinate synthase n=1 Tax=Exiguobacterium TaxID=33986 RepID=UPI00047AFC60|nr:MULTISPECIES: 3-dehydroquinate synthase family protein [Exiguobacterium]MCT4779333.1 3-dehydroquinate synthase [Exiguobacterium soli]